MDFEEIDTVDITSHFEDKLEEIKEETKKAFNLDDDLEDTLVYMLQAMEYLSKRKVTEEVLLSYYENCFNNIKDELLIKYKYGKVLRDPKRIEVTIQTSIEWEKHDMLVFGQKNVCDFIEQRLRVLKNQIFTIRDIIDYKKAFIA